MRSGKQTRRVETGTQKMSGSPGRQWRGRSGMRQGLESTVLEHERDRGEGC